MRLKKIRWILIITLILYLLGIFSPPLMEYEVSVELPPHQKEIRNITLLLPFPYYKGIPLPYYKGKPIKQIYELIYYSAKLQNANCKLIKTPRYEYMLKLFIPKLSRSDEELNTHKILLQFPYHFKSSFFFTPLYFFYPPAKIFGLNPVEEKWYWVKDKPDTFVSRQELKTLIFAEFPAECIISLNFKIKKRILFGEIFLQEVLIDKGGTSITLKKKGRHKLSLKRIEKKRWI